VPDSTLNQAIKEAYASAPTDVLVYYTLEVTHPDFATSARLVLGHEDVTLGGQVWTAAAFEMQLPDVSAQGDMRLRVRFDNVGGELFEAIDAVVESDSPVEIVYRVWLSTNLSTPANSSVPAFALTAVSADRQTITAEATLGPFQNKRWPRLRYRDEYYPGLLG
jgi:hypothetical protein